MVKASMNLNRENNTIELKFERKPEDATLSILRDKSNGWYWHRAKRLWYAKQTDARLNFANKVCGAAPDKKGPVPDHKKETSQSLGQPDHPSASLPNTFAACYDKIGDAVILKDAGCNLMEYMEAFCEKEQLFFRRTYGGESIRIVDLSNAQKTGKTCDSWLISPSWEMERNTSLLTSLQNAGADSIAKLAELCSCGESYDGIAISHHAEKGVDTFSPFVEVKPLKELPEKWTKRNFTQALMSGQLFRGEVAYRYTDDYAYDAAYDYGTGRGLNMPAFVKNEVGDWSSCTSCRNTGDGPDQAGIYQVSYSEYSNSCKTLYFDVNCDIGEGKRRAEAREAAIEQYNKMMKASCIQVSPDEIDSSKIYHVVELNQNINTGIYGSKESNLQGDVLRDRLDPECCLMDVLSVDEMEIQPYLFYSVANFHQRMPESELGDQRIIPVGNWGHIVTGKALLELTKEGQYFPRIEEARGDIGPTFEQALDNLTKLANGSRRYMMGGDKTDYYAAIDKLVSEYQRAGGIVPEVLIPAPSKTPLQLDAMVKSAQNRQAEQLADRSRESNNLDFSRT